MKITKRSTLAAVASCFFGSWFTPRLSGAQANAAQQKRPVSALLDDRQPGLRGGSGHENRNHSPQVGQIVADEG